MKTVFWKIYSSLELKDFYQNPKGHSYIFINKCAECRRMNAETCTAVGHFLKMHEIVVHGWVWAGNFGTLMCLRTKIGTLIGFRAKFCTRMDFLVPAERFGLMVRSFFRSFVRSSVHSFGRDLKNCRLLLFLAQS